MRSPVRRLIARAIKEIIRRHDIAARYGGDEFAIILPDTTLQAAEVAERLRVEANGAQAREAFRAADYPADRPARP
jgi:diguanylate cyclase (GGDEF)-like protein